MSRRRNAVRSGTAGQDTTGGVRPGDPVPRLLSIMARLRDPRHGCPWDRAQDFATIAPYTIEEAHEVADAIERGDFDDLRDELGDLLFQVVFHARMAEEAGHFDFSDVVDTISDKLERRHPHVFGDVRAGGADTPAPGWEAIKRAEREAAGDEDRSVLAGIAHGLPGWRRALKLQARAAQLGFDWPDLEPVLAKLLEEVGEIREVLRDGGDRQRLGEEIGDLLFVCVNIARHAGIDTDTALRSANSKFERRFRRMETLAEADGRELSELDLDGQEALWCRAKREEAGHG